MKPYHCGTECDCLVIFIGKYTFNPPVSPLSSDLYKGPLLPPHAELHEMNKAQQPITGSPSTPHPAPSPGLSQVRHPAV